MVRVAYCPGDPNGLTTFDSFDPDSYSVAIAIADSLVEIGTTGSVVPGLATSWRRVSPTAIELELRREVRFHDGSLLDAEDVVATFEAHRLPTPSVCGSSILAPVVNATALGRHTVRVESAFPDALLLHRMAFGLIYARHQLRAEGRDGVGRRPIGTGPFRFVRWDRGDAVVLERHAAHWAGSPAAQRLEICIMRENQRISRLARGEIDVVFNLDAHDAVRARRLPGVTVTSRASAFVQAFVLRDRGPLADERVRRALNHALHRRLLVELTEHGMGAPLRGLATVLEEGYAACPPYRYNPDRSRALLAEAGYGAGLTLRGVVGESCSALFDACREMLSRVGVALEAEVVPSTALTGRLVDHFSRGEKFDGDFIVITTTNPVGHALFLQFVHLSPQGPASLTADPELAAAFHVAATTIERSAGLEATRAVERMAVERALMLFTIEREGHTAARAGVTVHAPRTIPTGATFRSLHVAPGASQVERPRPIAASGNRDVGHLLAASSYTDLFYLDPAARFASPAAAQIWHNLEIHQERARMARAPLLRQVVSLIDARESLDSVLDSTHRIAIVGYDEDGRQRFVNRGYRHVLGDDERHVIDRLPRTGTTSWAAIRAEVDATGAWSGSVMIDVRDHHQALFLTVTQALDQDRARAGYTFVFSDYAGEEERIRTRAHRALLEHVPGGLFMCDRAGRVLPGYSASCARWFLHDGGAIEQELMARLLGLDARTAVEVGRLIEQIYDGEIADQAALAALPRRVQLGALTCDLRGAVIRGANHDVQAVLFSLIDVTDQVRAEDDARRMQAALHDIALANAHHAGMAEIAAGVLHNVSNILNSITVSCDTLDGHLRSRSPSIDKVVELLGERLSAHAIDDAKLAGVAQFFARLGPQLDADVAAMRGELDALRAQVARLSSEVAAQEAYATGEFLVEDVDLAALVVDVLALRAQALRDARITVERALAAGVRAPVHRTKLVHILINLISNAVEAMAVTPDLARTLVVSVDHDEAQRAFIQIRDTGEGIAREDLHRVFGHGFTTRQRTRGLGLHTASNSMSEMGGRIVADSPGRDHGATFTLTFGTGVPRGRRTTLPFDDPAPVVSPRPA